MNNRFEGVADTLYIPLTARIYVSEDFPQYFRDEKALSLKAEIPELVHAKLIRTHTCTVGSDSCDYWYVGDESKTAKEYAAVKML